MNSRIRSSIIAITLGALTALAVTAGAATFTDGSPGQLSMTPGDNLHVQCPTQVAAGNMSSTAFDATCAPMPVTTSTSTTSTIPATTTTTAPATTTTTAPSPTTTTTIPGGPNTSSCRFDSAPAGDTAAFCDSFNTPSNVGSLRSPALDPVWGVSRLLGQSNFGQQQYNATAPTQLDKCGTTVNVQPPNDVQICNGQLVEAQTDQHGVTALAMYPKQPFDIAGRTGTISLDVSNDSHGIHRAWPEIWYTDTPQPAPVTHFDSFQSVPKNGIGVRFANACPPGFAANCGGRYPSVPTGPWVTVDSADIVTNFASNDPAFGPTPSTLNVQVLDAVRMSTGPGDNNHFELRLSANQIDVYGTDAGTVAPLRHLAVISNFTMPLTRGLVWAEDVHYNGDKDGPDQGTHTFSWDNIGFDGPLLPRDLAFDVADANTPTPGYPGLINEGWYVPTGGTNSVALTVPGVTGIAQAAGAVVTFNYFTYNPVTISVKLNGGPWHDVPWPFPTGVMSNRTLALPVPLSEVVAGNNTVQFKSSDGNTAVANVNLILVGAGG